MPLQPEVNGGPDKHGRSSGLARHLFRPWIPGLDGIRAGATITMILYAQGVRHVPGFGVTVFFVLSGFLTTWWLTEEEHREGRIRPFRFWARRAGRILPVLWVYCAVVIARSMLQGSQVPWGSAASAMFLFQNYRLAIGDGAWTSFGFAWVLSIQAQFFLLWPLVLTWLTGAKARAPRRLTFMIVAIWAWRLLLVGLGFDEQYRFVAFDTRVDAILVGCLLAIILRWRPTAWLHRLEAPSPYVALGTIAMLVVAFQPVDLWGAWYRDSVARIAEPPLVALALTQVVAHIESPVWRWLDSAPFRYLGRIALGMCLFQNYAFAVADRLAVGAPPLFGALLGVALTALAGSASFLIVERPFLRLSQYGARAANGSVGP